MRKLVLAGVAILVVSSADANSVRLCDLAEAKNCDHCYKRDNPRQVQRCFQNCQAGTGGRKNKG